MVLTKVLLYSSLQYGFYEEDKVNTLSVGECVTLEPVRFACGLFEPRFP